MRLIKANHKQLIVNKHNNTTFNLCNKYLDENKIKRNLKVMFSRLFINNVCKSSHRSINNFHQNNTYITHKNVEML